MPRRPSKEWHEPFLLELAKTRNIDKSATSAGITRATAYRHHRQDPAFAARWAEALKWQTAFLKSLSLSGNVTLAARSVGLSRRAACAAREQDPEFAAEWDAALWEGLETLEGLGLKYATENMSEGMLKFLITSARTRLGPDPLATAAGGRPMAGAPMAEAPMAASDPAPVLTFTDENGVERPVSEWKGGEADASEWQEGEADPSEWEGGEADAEEVGLRRGAANPTYIERQGMERPGMERPGMDARTGIERPGMARGTGTAAGTGSNGQSASDRGGEV